MKNKVFRIWFISSNSICWIIVGWLAKNLKATLLFIDFSKVFDSIHKRETEQILLTYDLLKETVTPIIMLYKIIKAMVCSLGDTNFFNIVAGVLQGDTLMPYLFIICLDCILRTSIDLIK